LAGYAHPQAQAYALMTRAGVGDAAREAARQFLRSEGAAIAIGGLAVIALDEKQPAGARVSAMRELAKLSGIAGDERDGKDPAEMTLEELRRATEKTRLRASLLEHALADAASPVIEGDSKPGSVLD
jgi:hypothetical protein